MRPLLLTLLAACAATPDAPTDATDACPVTPACDLVDEAQDVDGDGAVDLRSVYAWADGQKTDELHDHDGDGAWDQLIQRDFDDQGRLVSFTEDWGGDGVLDTAQRHTWQAAGPHLVHVVTDDLTDLVERVETITLDEAGREVERAVDDLGDGTIESRLYTSRDGLLERIALDNGDDGIIDMEVEQVYDAQARPVAQSLWHWGALTGRMTWSYTPCGQVAQTTIEEGGAIMVVDTTWDDRGRANAITLTVDGALTRDIRTTWTGDVGVQEERDAGGAVLRRTELHVDPAGQVTFERRDHTADGTWDQHLWRTWSCEA
jgi:hypothetical protein